MSNLYDKYAEEAKKLNENQVHTEIRKTQKEIKELSGNLTLKLTALEHRLWDFEYKNPDEHGCDYSGSYNGM